MKNGVLLAGGKGSRLRPLTFGTSKHLLNVFNKPLLYYPLSTLLLAGVREIVVVATHEDLPNYQRLLGDGSRFGVSLTYRIQAEAGGLAQAVSMAESVFEGEEIAVILGDNIFYGAGLGALFRQGLPAAGASIFAHRVKDPERYGVVELSPKGMPKGIVEKPSQPKSDLAVTGLYFFDDSVFDRIRSLKPSNRGELEITDLNNSYLKDGQLSVTSLPRGTAWFDAGTFESLAIASEYVRVVESRQEFLISSPEEIAFKLGYISRSDLTKTAECLLGNSYGEYLLRIANDDG